MIWKNKEERKALKRGNVKEMSQLEHAAVFSLPSTALAAANATRRLEIILELNILVYK